MKTCPRCRKEKDLGSYYSNRSTKDGLTAYCKLCWRAMQREWKDCAPEKYANQPARKNRNRRTPTNNSWRSKNPLARNAQAAVERALKRGELVRPERCPGCDRSDVRIEAHHKDYERKLDVEWLCTRCHRQQHLLPL